MPFEGPRASRYNERLAMEFILRRGGVKRKPADGTAEPDLVSERSPESLFGRQQRIRPCRARSVPAYCLLETPSADATSGMAGAVALRCRPHLNHLTHWASCGCQEADSAGGFRRSETLTKDTSPSADRGDVKHKQAMNQCDNNRENAVTQKTTSALELVTANLWHSGSAAIRKQGRFTNSQRAPQRVRPIPRQCK